MGTAKEEYCDGCGKVIQWGEVFYNGLQMLCPQCINPPTTTDNTSHQVKCPYCGGKLVLAGEGE